MTICRAGFLLCGASSGNPPVAPAGAPFADTGIVGTPIGVTHGTWTGDAPISLSASGLPASVSFTDNGDGTYTLNGNFPATSGTTNYTVTATNAAGSTMTIGNSIVANAATSVISATINVAPSFSNPGGADPSAGTNTSLIDTSGDGQPSPSIGLHKSLMLVVSNISGGTGPYTVDFSGVSWSIGFTSTTPSLDPAWDAEVFWDANVNVVDVNATGNQSVAGTNGTVGGATPAGSTVSGLTSADYAKLAPRLTVPIAPNAAILPVTVTHQYLGGSIVITDSLGATETINFPSFNDSWEVTTTATPP